MREGCGAPQLVRAGGVLPLRLPLPLPLLVPLRLVPLLLLLLLLALPAPPARAAAAAPRHALPPQHTLNHIKANILAKLGLSARPRAVGAPPRDVVRQILARAADPAPAQPPPQDIREIIAIAHRD